MSRFLLAAALLANIGAAGEAFAQAGCQPTIMQPCAKVPDKASNQPARSTTQSGDTGEPKDHSPRIRLNNDTDFKFGTGGLGLQRKF